MGCSFVLLKTVIADKRTGVVTNGNAFGAIPAMKCYVFNTLTFSERAVVGSLRIVFWHLISITFHRCASVPAIAGLLSRRGRVCGVPPLAMLHAERHARENLPFSDILTMDCRYR